MNILEAIDNLIMDSKIELRGMGTYKENLNLDYVALQVDIVEDDIFVQFNDNVLQITYLHVGHSVVVEAQGFDDYGMIEFRPFTIRKDN